MKNPLLSPSLVPNSMTFPLRKVFVMLAAGAITLSGVSSAQAQVWHTPYTSGSAADLTLNFNNGAAGNATSPNIPFAIGLSFNDTTPGIGTGGGWGLSATGTAAVGVGVIIVGETHTRTNVGSGALTFQMTTTGVSQIAGLSMGSKWAATSTIAGSDSWALPSDSMRYTFDAVLSADLLSLSPAIFSSFSLTIQAGSDILFQGTLASILPTLTPVVTGASVEFTYDQSSGPLQINWSGDGTVNSALLGILGNGTNTIFGVSNGAIQVDAIPEPGTYALLLGGLGSLMFFRRRRGC